MTSEVISLTRPFVNSLLQYVQRHRALGQHDVVKAAEIELCAQARGRLRAELANLELTNLVAERLTGPDDVPIDLDADVLRGLRRVGGEELDRLLARPAHRMQPGVDD